MTAISLGLGKVLGVFATDCGVAAEVGEKGLCVAVAVRQRKAQVSAVPSGKQMDSKREDDNRECVDCGNEFHVRQGKWKCHSPLFCPFCGSEEIYPI